jgi:hypothetical protein
MTRGSRYGYATWAGRRSESRVKNPLGLKITDNTWNYPALKVSAWKRDVTMPISTNPRTMCRPQRGAWGLRSTHKTKKQRNAKQACRQPQQRAGGTRPCWTPRASAASNHQRCERCGGGREKQAYGSEAGLGCGSCLIMREVRSSQGRGECLRFRALEHEHNPAIKTFSSNFIHGSVYLSISNLLSSPAIDELRMS